MSKRISILLLVFFISFSIFSPVSANGSQLKGKVEIRATIDESIKGDISVTISNLNSGGVYSALLLERDNYTTTMTLPYGEYKIILAKYNTDNQNLYNNNYGDKFKITSNLEVVNMSINQRKQNKDTGWVELKADIPTGFDKSIMIYMSGDTNFNHRLSIQNKYTAYLEVPHGEYKIIDVKVEFDENNVYEVSNLKEFHIDKSKKNLDLVFYVNKKSTQIHLPEEPVIEEPVIEKPVDKDEVELDPEEADEPVLVLPEVDEVIDEQSEDEDIEEINKEKEESEKFNALSLVAIIVIIVIFSAIIGFCVHFFKKFYG